jgi:Spy/CpxP family protein refolding chaperone
MVKNRLTTLLAVALALGLSATSVFAQQGQGGGRGGRGGFGGGMGFGGQRDVLSLVTNEAVVKELAVSEENAAKLKKVSDEFREDVRKATGERPGRDASETERTEWMKKSVEANKTAHATYAPKVKEILTAEQYTRAQQIAYQASGVAAFTNPEVVAALALTKEQEDKIAAANKDAGEKMRALRGNGGNGGGGGGGFEKIQEINKERDTQVAAVLTADQNAKWTALKGKEFDVAKLRGQGGPGGPNRRGGAGGRPAAN